MPRPTEGAYTELFRAHFTAVTRAVFLVVGSTARADEIGQEAFEVLWRHWGRIGRYDRPEAWVRRVALRLAVRAARRERRGLELHDVAAPREATADDQPDVDLSRAIGELSPNQRACVVLFYLDDQPIADVARVLGLSTSTVKQHLFRARTRLADALGDKESDHVG